MRFSKFLGLVCTFALALAVMVVGQPAPAQAAVVTYYVNSSNVKLNVRSTANGTVVDKLNHGVKVSHDNSAKNRVKAGAFMWRKVTFAKNVSEKGKTTGWVAEQYLSTKKPATGGGSSGGASTPAKTVAMTVNSPGTKLNVRKTANGTQIDKLKHGAKVSWVNTSANKVKAGNYTWRKITFAKGDTEKGNTTGWVAEDYLKTTGTSTPAPKPPSTSKPPAATTMYVNSPGVRLNVRKTANGILVDQLAHAVKVSWVNTAANKVKAGSHTWRKVTFAKADSSKGNTTGWVAEQYLTTTNPKPPAATKPPAKPAPPAPKKVTMYVSSSNAKLNVRTTPNGSQVDKLSNGAKVTHTDAAANRVRAGNHTWRLIEFPKSASEKGYTRGWVAEQFLTTKAPGTPAPPKPTPTPTPTPKPPKNSQSFVVSTGGIKLNVRAKPNGQSKDKILDRTEVTHEPIAANTAKAGNYTWKFITFPKARSEKGSTSGWVADEFLTKAGGNTPPPPSAGKVPTSFSFTGSGYGHGVGMPQYGAYQMAREGKSAAQILGHYYTGSAVTNSNTPEYIRVQILGPEPYKFTGYARERTTATFELQNKVQVPTAKFSVQDAAAKNIANAANLPATHRVNLSVSGTSVKATVVDKDGKKVAETTQPKLNLVWSGTSRYDAKGPKAIAQVTGAQGTYRHGRMIVSVIGGKLNVVNELKLNTEYLYGIAEVPSSWGNNGGTAALSAQAITARTYALSRSSVNAKCDCNVVDDVRDQNFTGWKKEGEGSNASFGKIWSKAVDSTVTSATNAQVLTKDGKRVTTYYYSYSGGKTSNSEDVWASNVNYLRSVNDPYSLSAPGSPGQWVHTVTQAQARNLFPTLTDVAKIEITASYSSGQLKTLKATASNGQAQSRTMKADQWRTAVKGKNNKVATGSSSSSLPGSWVSKITPNN